MIVKEERVQIVDHTSYPVMIPTKFFTKFHPSPTALAVFVALDVFDEEDAPDRSQMAKFVSLSESAFEEGFAELVEKRVVRVPQPGKTAGKSRPASVVVYEILI